MVVKHQFPRVTYTRDDSLTFYPVPFNFGRAERLKVSAGDTGPWFTWKPLILGMQYKVYTYPTGGGDVKILSPNNIPNFAKLVIESDVPFENLTSVSQYRNGHVFEAVFDNLEYQIQQLACNVTGIYGVIASGGTGSGGGDILPQDISIACDANYIPTISTRNMPVFHQSPLYVADNIVVVSRVVQAPSLRLTKSTGAAGTFFTVKSTQSYSSVVYFDMNPTQLADETKYYPLLAKKDANGELTVTPSATAYGEEGGGVGTTVTVVCGAGYLPVVATTDTADFAQSKLFDGGTYVKSEVEFKTPVLKLNHASDKSLSLMIPSTQMFDNIVELDLDPGIIVDGKTFQLLAVRKNSTTCTVYAAEKIDTGGGGGTTVTVVCSDNYLPIISTANTATFGQSHLYNGAEYLEAKKKMIVPELKLGNAGGKGTSLVVSSTQSFDTTAEVNLSPSIIVSGKTFQLVAEQLDDTSCVIYPKEIVPVTVPTLSVTENTIAMGDSTGSVQNSAVKQDAVNLEINTDYSYATKRSLRVKASLSTGYTDFVVPQNQTNVTLVVEDFNTTAFAIGNTAPLFITKVDANTFRIFVNENLTTRLIFTPPYPANGMLYWMGHSNAFEATAVKAHPIVKVYSDFIEGASFQDTLKADVLAVEQKTMTGAGDLVINPLESTLFFINYDSSITSINFQPAVSFGNAIMLCFFRISNAAVVHWPSNWLWIKGVAPDSSLFTLNTQIRIHLVGIGGYLLATLVTSSLTADTNDDELTLLEPWVDHSALSYFNASGALVVENPVAKVQGDVMSNFTFNEIQVDEDAKEINDILIANGVLTLNVVPTTSNVFRFTHDTDITSIVVNVDSTLLDAAFVLQLIREPGLSTQVEAPLPSTARYPMDDTTIKYGAGQAMSVFTYIGRSYFMYGGTFRS